MIQQLTSRTCSSCEIEQMLTEFCQDSVKSPPGYKYNCKNCVNKRAHAKAEINKEKSKTIDATKVTKQCTGPCGKKLALMMFNFYHSNGEDGHANMCKICKSEYRKKHLNTNPQTEGTKFCYSCGKDEDVTEFSIDIYSEKDGLQTYCKTCQKTNGRIFFSKLDKFLQKLINDAKQRCKKSAKIERNITVEITFDDVMNLYKIQRGKCAITGRKMTHNCVNDREADSQHIMNLYNISIDRIDSTKGYTKNNIRLICAAVNRIRLDLTDIELSRICLNVIQTAKFKFIEKLGEKHLEIFNKKTINIKEY